MKSHRKSPTPEQKAAAQTRRADLIARTRPLQAARKSGLLPWSELPTINACLEIIYARETGQSDWKTFLGWKEAGLSVKKGEKGFPIWGRPIGSHKQRAAEESSEPTEIGFDFFPVSYLFHAGQVADEDGNTPASGFVNLFTAELKKQPLALPAPAKSELAAP